MFEIVQYKHHHPNVQNQTKFAANYKTPAGLTVEEKVGGQNYGTEQMAAGQAPARSFTREQALLEGKGTSLSNVKELARGNKTLSLRKVNTFIAFGMITSLLNI